MANMITSTINQIVQRSGKKIWTTISSACLITCGIIPVAVMFRMNPFLSNEKYKQQPQETTKYLLMTAVPMCLFLFNFTAYFNYASYHEGKLNLQGGVISRTQALLITFTYGYYHLNTLFSVLAYPLVLHIGTFVISWEMFMFYNLHCIAATINIFFVSWVAYFHGIRILLSQMIIHQAKVLDPCKIQFKKFGIMTKKKDSKRKQSRWRVWKLSFQLVFPCLLISIFLFVFTGATRYILQQSQLVQIIYCPSILLLKVGIQAMTRNAIVKLGISAPDSVIYISILGNTVLVDCPIRIIFSQIESSANFILVASAVGVAEICLRCASIRFAIRKKELCHNELYSKDSMTGQKKAKKLVSLIMLEVDADMASEYVAIIASFMLNWFFGHYNGFLVGGKETFDIVKQLAYFIFQIALEMLVDFISYAFESYHPVIREIMAESVPPPQLAVITANLIVGIYCMLVLILLIV